MPSSMFWMELFETGAGGYEVIPVFPGILLVFFHCHIRNYFLRQSSMNDSHKSEHDSILQQQKA